MNNRNREGHPLLALDIGNSNISIGLSRGRSWIERWRIRTVIDKTPDEYGILFRSLLAGTDIHPERIESAILASVVPPLTETITEALVSLTGKPPLQVAPGIRTGIRIRTDNPVEVGADLVADAVAGYERFKSNCIIVDFGTALTFTAVAEPGDLMGVVIAPGLKYATEALAMHTAQLPEVELKAPPAAIGRNTIHSIQSGVMFGYVGMVEALLGRIKSELPGGESRVIATGGQAHIIASLTKELQEIDPWLTLDGLRLIAERNA